MTWRVGLLVISALLGGVVVWRYYSRPLRAREVYFMAWC